MGHDEDEYDEEEKYDEENNEEDEESGNEEGNDDEWWEEHEHEHEYHSGAGGDGQWLMVLSMSSTKPCINLWSSGWWGTWIRSGSVKRPQRHPCSGKGGTNLRVVFFCDL